MLYDFHTHTFLSDGVLSPIEQVRRAQVNGYTAIGLTDHAGLADAEETLRSLVAACRTARLHMGMMAIPGVELTHLPPAAIAEAAAWARAHGAELIIVHGETIVEPTAPGTNHAAVTCSAVDILAHPGFLSEEDARLAAANGVFIEVTARGGHNTTNGHVVNVGRRVGARFLVNSDGHEPKNLLDEAFARQVALGAGLSEDEAFQTLHENPRLLLQRLGL